LIDEDNDVIRYLSDKAAQRWTAVNQATSLVEERRRRLAEAEQRLETATSLHEFFVKNNRTPSALDLSPMSPSEPSSAGAGQRQQFDNLMAIADTYIQSTRIVVEQAALAMEEARDCVALQREELQAAMTILMMYQDGHALLKSQILELERAVMQKASAFRAIWRMPVEIWRMIFELMIEENETEINLESGEDLKYGREQRGCEMLQLSEVCHHWRGLIQSLPALWSHIHIPQYVTPGDLERISHYYGLCDKARLSITVSSPTLLDVRCFKPLYNLFYTSIPCKKMTLLIRAPGVPALNAFLPSLPPPTELSIVRYPQTGGPEEMERTPAPTIPRSYCSSIRKLYISAAGAQWLDEPAMRLEKYFITAPPVSAIFGPHRFIPSSLQSLTSIGIQGRLYDATIPPPAMRVTLSNVRETIMDLNFLVTIFTRHYHVPALRKLTIPAGSNVTQEDWQMFLTEVRHAPSDITDLCCHSFEDGQEILVDCIVSLRELTRLELRGSNVDLALELLYLKIERDPDLLPNLTHLVVQSYDGTGHAILSLLEGLYPPVDAQAAINEEDTRERKRRSKIEVALRACRGITVEIRKTIGGFAKLV
jgi:GAF domain-containing protein